MKAEFAGVKSAPPRSRALVPDEFTSVMEGNIYERIGENRNICGEPWGQYKYYFKAGLGQEPIRQLIEDLQQTLAVYEKMGIK